MPLRVSRALPVFAPRCKCQLEPPSLCYLRLITRTWASWRQVDSIPTAAVSNYDTDQGGPTNQGDLSRLPKLTRQTGKLHYHGNGVRPVTSPLSIRSTLLEKFAPLSALLAIPTGTLVLVGWIFDIGALRSVLPGLVDMKANADERDSGFRATLGDGRVGCAAKRKRGAHSKSS